MWREGDQDWFTFFFQAEDGIRDKLVTGVQTCALPIWLQARLMSQALRKLTAAISRSGAVLIFINQIREKIGIMFGNPETQPGGRALKFYASIRMDIRRQDAIKQGTESLGVRTKVKVVKNKLAPPH